jgi:uncharacterized protein (DUF58 family)
MALHPRLDDLLELRHQAHALGMASHHLVGSNFSGLYASVFRGSGLDFDEVREYQQGDDVRNMEWKVTARTNAPHMKVFREERERSVVLVVDQGPHMSFGTRGTFKSVQAARAAALLGWAANAVQDRVGGLLFGNQERGMQHFRPTKDRRALWRLLKALSQPAAEGSGDEDSLAKALQHAERGAATGGLILVIGDFNRETQSLESLFGRLCQRHTLALIPIDDIVDRELPRMGRTVFAAPDGEMIEVNTDDEAGQRAYTEVWEQHRTALLGLANRLGMPCIPVGTDEDPHPALTRGLQQSARMRILR